jgi:hypothetical protein
MATGPDDSLHIAWYQMAQGIGLPEEYDRLIHMVLGADGKWRTPEPIVVAKYLDPAVLLNPAAPYVAADADPPTASSVGYLAWFNYKPDRFAVAACTTAGDSTSCESHLALDLTPKRVGMEAPVGAIRLRLPIWAFAASPNTRGKLALAVSVSGFAGEWPLPQHDIWITNSDDGGKVWSAPDIVPTTMPGSRRLAPTLTMLGDDSLLVSYYEHDLETNQIQPLIAIRKSTGVWLRGYSGPPFAIDLTRAPHKCIDNADVRFIGDYHIFLGGLTHARYMRADPLAAAMPGICSGRCLWSGAVSETCY